MASSAITFDCGFIVVFIFVGWGLVAHPIPKQFAELEEQDLADLVLVPFRSVLHFDAAAHDVCVASEVLHAESLQILGFGGLAFPVEPVSPAKLRNLEHGQPLVSLVVFDQLLA
jgi:hypothetical protein